MKANGSSLRKINEIDQPVVRQEKWIYYDQPYANTLNYFRWNAYCFLKESIDTKANSSTGWLSWFSKIDLKSEFCCKPLPLAQEKPPGPNDFTREYY